MNPEEKIAREVAMSFADIIGVASIRAAKSALKQAKESEAAKLAALRAAGKALARHVAEDTRGQTARQLVEAGEEARR